MVGREPAVSSKADGEGNSFILFYYFIHSFIHFGLPWVFIAVRRLSLVAASGAFSLQWLLLLRSTGSRRAQASVVVACRL